MELPVLVQVVLVQVRVLVAEAAEKMTVHTVVLVRGVLVGCRNPM
jgi:hypothetical protein